MKHLQIKSSGETMRNLINQLLKFGIVGIIATVIDFLLLTILTEFFSVYYLISAGISFIVSTIFNYLASMKFVFVSRYDKTHRRQEMLIFFILSIIGLLLNQVFMWFFVELVMMHYIVGKVFATVLVMAWNFISRKIWLEK